MVLLALLVSAFVAGATSGGSLAWWIQGLNLKECSLDQAALAQEFRQYKQDIKDQEIQHEIAANQQRQDSAMEYAAQQGALNHEIEAGVVFKRCVAAGKCGRVREQPACSPSLRLPAIGGNDGAGPDAIPAGRDATEDISEAVAVVNDCAVTTLRLNRLQSEIEGQDGYWQ